MAVVVSGPTAQITAGTEQGESIGTPGNRGRGMAGLRERFRHARRRCPQTVDPQIQRRHLIAGGGHRRCPLLIAPLQQELRQPVGQGMLEGQLHRRIPGTGWPLPLITGPQSGPQHSVHHRRQACQPMGFRQLDAGVHSRGVGNPFHPEQLIQTHVQQPAQLRGLLLRRHPSNSIEPGIQPPPLTDGAIGQLGGQATVRTLQRPIPQRPLQGDIGIGSRRYRLQHLPGQASRRQTGGRGLAQTPLSSLTRHSARSPEELTQRQTTLLIHRNALGDQQLPLDPVAALAAEAHGDAPLGIHHPMPGHR